MVRRRVGAQTGQRSGCVRRHCGPGRCGTRRQSRDEDAKVKRTIAIGIAVLGALTLVLASAPPAGARTFAKIRFHADNVTLKIPTPPCRPTHGTTSCQWTLAVTENLGPVTGRATGTAGSLRVPYPANYCGVIHAVAIVGPPMRKEVGHKTTIGGTCPTPATTPRAPVHSGGRRRSAHRSAHSSAHRRAHRAPGPDRATGIGPVRAPVHRGPDLGPAGRRGVVSGPRRVLSAEEAIELDRVGDPTSAALAGWPTLGDSDVVRKGSAIRSLSCIS